MGVLRDVAADRVAQPAREREPDPQGALPTPARAALDRGDTARRVRRHDRHRDRARDDRAAATRGRPRGSRFRSARVFVLFVSGLSLAVASANAIFRDIEFVVAAMLLPLFFLTPVLYSLDNLPVAAAHPWLLDLHPVGQPADAARRVLPGAALLRRDSLERRPALPPRRDGGGPRARRGRVQRRSTTGSPRKCDGDPAVEQPVLTRVGREPEVRRRLGSVEQRRQQQRTARSAGCGRRPPRQGANSPGVGPRGAIEPSDRGPALGVRVEQQRRDQSGGGIAPATRCATASAVRPSTTGSSWAASAAVVTRIVVRRAPARRGGGRRSAARPRSRARAGRSRPRRTRTGAPRRGRTPAGRRPAAGARAPRARARPARPGATGWGAAYAGTVPDDRVAERVEPVVRRLHAVRAVRAPGRRAGVLEPRRGRHRARLRAAASSDQASQRGCERAGRGQNARRRDSRWGYSSSGESSRFSCAPRGARKSSGRRCGSCARRAGRFPNIAPSASSTRSSMSPTRPSCARR